MKFVKILSLILFFLASVIAFLPKKSLYYYGEEKLAGYKTIIANEALDEGVFSLQIAHPDIYVEGIRAAKAMEAKIHTYIISSGIEVHNIRLSGVAKDFLPTKVETLVVHYDLWNPLHITFNANGAFGTAEGSYSLRTHRVTIILHPSKMMQSRYRSILRRMKKTKNGGYSYEQRL